MAPKDFAEVAGPAPQRSGGINWRAMLVVAAGLLVVAGGFVAGYSLGVKRGRMLAEHADKQRLLDEIRKQKEELARIKQQSSKAKVEDHSTEVGELTFYNDLPKQAVTPAPLSEASAPPTRSGATAARRKGADSDVGDIIQHHLAHSGAGRQTSSNAAAHAARPAAGGDWRVQVGSYQRREDAEALAGKTRGQGFPVMVEQTNVPGLGMWFRVYVGPFAARSEAERAQVKVRKVMHISGLVLHARK